MAWSTGRFSWMGLILAALAVALMIASWVLFKDFGPKPGRTITLAAGEPESDEYAYAKQYRELLKDEGIDVQLVQSSGVSDNLKVLQDPHSKVDAGFVLDGLDLKVGDDDASGLESLGSLYYQPIWIFYRSHQSLTRVSELTGKKIAVGVEGGGTHFMATQLLTSAGINAQNTTLISQGWNDAALLLKQGKVDALLLLATGEDSLVKALIQDPTVQLMSVDQADALTRRMPYLHHIILPHGVYDLKKNIPKTDIHLVAPTQTMLIRDSLHPALIYRFLNVISQVHGESGIFEKKHEFPTDKDFLYPLNQTAQGFYKSGVPFWLKYLPFWLAVLIDRIMLIALPMIIVVLPGIRLIPQLMDWRVKSKIYQRYGELKFLETQIRSSVSSGDTPKYIAELKRIDDRVNLMNLPLTYSDHLYSLKGHIEMVRQKLGSS